MAVGLLLRVALAALLDGRMQPRGDELTYLRWGAGLLDQGQLETGNFVRPPLYFGVVALAAQLAGLWSGSLTLTAKLLQCLLSTATALPVYRTAHRVGGRRVARLASGLLLLDPTLIGYTHLLWPETLLLFALALICDAIPGLDSRRAPAIAGYGALFGAAMLLKPVSGLLALMLACHWWWQIGWRRALRLSLVFGLAALAVVAPWAIRNQLRYGPTIVLENQGPYNLWIGNDPTPAPQILREWNAIGDPVERSRTGMERGLAAIRSDPAAFLHRSALRAVNLWGLEFFVVRHIVTGGYGRVDRTSLLAVAWLLQSAWALSLLAAALGMARAWRDPTLRLLLLHALVFTLLVATMVGTTRFRVPFAFLLAVTGGLGLDALLSRRAGWRELLAAVLALALLASSASRPLFRTLLTGSFQRPAEFNTPEYRFFRY